MTRFTLSLVAVTFAVFVSSVQAFPSRCQALWHHFVVTNGYLDWTPAHETPSPHHIAQDFWAFVQAFMPLSAPLHSVDLPVHGQDTAPVHLSVLDAESQTVLCHSPLPLTPRALALLQALGCTERTPEDNARLQDAAKKALDRHQLTLLPSAKS